MKEAVSKAVIANEAKQSQKSNYSLPGDCFGRPSFAMTIIGF